MSTTRITDKLAAAMGVRFAWSDAQIVVASKAIAAAGSSVKGPRGTMLPVDVVAVARAAVAAC